MHTDTVPDAIVIKLANVPFIDLTGLIALEDALEALEKRGVTVALCCATDEVAKRLENAHITGTAPCPRRPRWQRRWLRSLRRAEA